MRHLFCLLLLLVPSLLAQLQCPGGASFFDFESCDPARRSQCPAGFACRRGSSLTDSAAVVNLCCDSSVMTITDWFNEAGLTPSVVPQTPLAQIPALRLNNLAPDTASPDIHISDEIIALTFPDYTTAIVNALQLRNPLVPGGYVHALTLVDPLTAPWALFASFNIPWPGGQFVDLTAARRGNGAFLTHIANTSVPTKDSYRSQYVVLLYQTMSTIPPEVQANITNCAAFSCVFSSLSPVLASSPVAGSFFYLTTARPMFAINPITNSSPSAQILSIIISTILAKFFF